MTTIYCPKCLRRVVQVGTDGRLKVRTRMLVLEKGQAETVVCGHCGEDVRLDVRDPELWQAARARLVVGRNR